MVITVIVGHAGGGFGEGGGGGLGGGGGGLGGGGGGLGGGEAIGGGLGGGGGRKLTLTGGVGAVEAGGMPALLMAVLALGPVMRLDSAAVVLLTLPPGMIPTTA